MNHLIRLILLLTIAIKYIVYGLVNCPDSTISEECGRCGSHNDPHILTFDDLYYDHHNDACYKYVTNCASSTGILPFEVCGCHYICAGDGGNDCGRGPSNIRCIGDISVTFYNTVTGNVFMTASIDFDAISGTPAMDTTITGSPTPLTSGFLYTFDTTNGHNFRYTLTSNYGNDQHIFEIYSGSSSMDDFYGYVSYQAGNLEIFLSENYFSTTTNTCGLCGYFDQDGGINDLTGYDNVQYVSPPIAGVISQTVNNQIEAFANTYLCGSTAPVNPNCTVSPDADDCYIQATTCCGLLWDHVLATDTWTNDIISAADFEANWLIGCARDLCAMTNNVLPVTCNLDDFVLSFAKQILLETATNDYPTSSCGEQPIIVDNGNGATTGGVGGIDFDNIEAAPCTLYVVANGDDSMNVTLSRDDGVTFNLIDSTTSWSQTSTTYTANVDIDTILQFHVEDSSLNDPTKESRGFVATVYLFCPNDVVHIWHTSCGDFEVISNEDENGLITTPPLSTTNIFQWAPYGSFGLSHSDQHQYAQWVWNGQKENKMIFQFDLGNYPNTIAGCGCDGETPLPTDQNITPLPTPQIVTPTPTISDDDRKNCSAKICCHGDNLLTLDVSYDGGSTWSLFGQETSWKNTLTGNINPLDANTILHFTVKDLHVVGGFICTVTLCGDNGYQYDIYTNEPNTYFNVIQETPNNDVLIDVFTPFGSNPWNGHVNKKKVQCMNKKADWIWNNHVDNTMVFEVDFSHHTDILEKLDCLSTTPQPTTDCCSLSIDDYLSMCYCDTNPLPTPQITPSPTTTCCDSPQILCFIGTAKCCPDGTWSCPNGFTNEYKCNGEILLDGIDTFSEPCCEPDPNCICITLFDPVCCDGQQYGNQCAADCQCATNCVSGPCSGGGISINDKDLLSSSSGAHSIGGIDVSNNNNNLYLKMVEENMKQIKYMIYMTWILIAICFIVLLLINIRSFCKNEKNNQFKAISNDDQDIDFSN